MDFFARRGASPCRTGSAARGCNDAWRKKTRFHVVALVKRTTSSRCRWLTVRIRAAIEVIPYVDINFVAALGRSGCPGFIDGLRPPPHNHVLATPQLNGWVLLPAEALEGERFELEFRLDHLELDAPAQRAALGADWASALSATRSNMLGDSVLQAESFPVVRLRGQQIVGAAPQLAVQMEVELHGQRKAQWLALNTELTDTTLRARAALVLRQSDFGIKPYSVAGGLLAVHDELVFELVAKR